MIRALGGTGTRESADVTVIAPEIAENGAVVPIQIVSGLPATQAIAIAIEKNPRLLAAYFEIPEGTLADIQTRVKMAETCNVYALVKADGGFYYASKEIKITAGGCGRLAGSPRRGTRPANSSDQANHGQADAHSCASRG